MDSIGNRLRAAREDKGLSIEDTAHQTRIQAIYIRGLENDDFSNFPSTTYAKSFLSLYSRFLDVDAEDALEQFAGGDAISLSGQGYLESVTDTIEPRRPSSPYSNRSSRPSAPRRQRRTRATSPGVAPLFLGVILLALVVAIPTFWLLGKDSESMDEVVSKGKELTNNKFSTSDPNSEKVDLEPGGAEPENAAKSGPPAPAELPSTPETKPVEVQTAPKETKVAQVTPPNSKRTLSPSSPGAASPVITGEKPKEIQARPVTEGPSASPGISEPAPSSPAPAPESAPATNQGAPLRAVPLIARPVIAPEEDAPEESDDPSAAETSEEDEDADSRNDGNQFPRPLE